MKLYELFGYDRHGVVGELDTNVDPASTMQVINQLIKANKNFDFLMVPGMKHSLGGDYGEHKRRDFFVKHLNLNNALIQEILQLLQVLERLLRLAI